MDTTAAPEVSCPRYFSATASSRRVPTIAVMWHDDFTFEVTLGDELVWRVELAR